MQKREVLVVKPFIRRFALFLFLAAAFQSSALTLSLSSEPQAGSIELGTRVSWTASTDAGNRAVLYHFRVDGPDGTRPIFEDFTRDPHLAWMPWQREGTYTITVTARVGTQPPARVSRTVEVLPRATAEPVVSATHNSLVALYSAPACGDGQIRVVYRAADDPAIFTTPWSECTPGVTSNFLIAGMRERTTYLLRHEQSNEPEQQETRTLRHRDDWLRFETGSIPFDLPEVTPVEAPRVPSGESMVLVSWLAPPAGRAFATDLTGRPIWYYSEPIYLITRPVSGGTLMVIASESSTSDTLREIDLAGNTLREIDITRLSRLLADMGHSPITQIHHDAIRLPDGSTAILGMSVRYFSHLDPPAQIGDTIIVLDENWQPVWAWDSFDHLDVNREPFFGALCGNGTPGSCYLAPEVSVASDWTHSNGLFYTPHDGNLLLSIRHQNWVIKVRYADGAGDGTVIWRLGFEGDFALEGSTSDTDWFSYQHDAGFDPATGRLWLYDNSNGRTLIDPEANSRGMVFVIDEEARTARIEHSFDLGHFAHALGSAQPLSNGAWHFHSGWLRADNSSAIVEADAAGARTILRLPALSYRSFRLRDLYGGY